MIIFLTIILRFVHNFGLHINLQMLILDFFPVCFSTIGSAIIESYKLVALVFNDRVLGRHGTFIGTIRNGVEVSIL